MLAVETYQQRRAQLREAVGSGLILFLGHDESPMNYRDNPYPFRQDSSFLYFFGLDSPGLAGIIDAETDADTLFGDDATLDDIVWTGPQTVLQERAAAVGVAQCHPHQALSEVLAAAIDHGRTVHFLPPNRSQTTLELQRLLRVPAADVPQLVSRSLIEAVVAQRSIKSEEEVSEIEKALALSHDMHTLAMRLTRPGVKEQEVVGAAEGLLLSHGSAVAFPVIFSVRGEILHNHRHDNVMQDGQLALHDSGAIAPTYYASDITRTFPVGGRFSQRQAQIYNIVLRAQEAAIEAVAPGVKFEDIHQLAGKILAQGLVELGLLRGSSEEIVAAGAHALFFPHGLGHMMGLDVHDMEGLGEDFVGYDKEVSRSSQFGRSALRLAKVLEPGFVVTIEPGLYFIPELIERWKSETKLESFIDYNEVVKWQDFGGVRIEDDVLVTEDGHRILGKPIPKTISEVEEHASQS
jgi:Xaa-Pro aminopeptidase